jgi:hypothetical protein
MADQKRIREIERRRAAGMADRSGYLAEAARRREAAAVWRAENRTWSEIAGRRSGKQA